MITIGATFDKMLKQRIFMLFNGNRDVTHTYNLTISTDKSQYNYKESIFIEGVLLKDGSPSSDALVYIFYDDTLVGTATTTSGGVFTKSISNNVVGEHEIKVICGSTESNIVEIVTGKISTSLDIDVPLSLVYSDAFNITGTLLDIDNIPLPNKPVKLKVGSTIVDTQTTNSNGVVSFTQTPVTTGTHTFQLVYSGDENYDGIDSTSVTRSVNKETTVLAVTSPTNNSAIYVDEGINVNGSLVTDDNENINGKSIVVKEGSTTISTYTTNSNGVFSGTITGLSVGTHTLTFQFIEDSNYTGSSITRTVIVNENTYSLSINTNFPTISPNNPVTISGVLTKNGVGLSNQTITIKEGNTVKGTYTTGNGGTYSGTITNLGVGTHTLKAVHSNVESATIDVKATSNYINATVTNNVVGLGGSGGSNWLGSNGNVVINWGDGTYNVINNPTTPLSHTYSDGNTNHNISIIGDITSLGKSCFNGSYISLIDIHSPITSMGTTCFAGSGLTSITIPDGVISLGDSCFYNSSALTSVTIPSSVTNIGSYCFYKCTALVDYQLYWTSSDILTYDANKLVTNSNTVFTIPTGQTANYVAKGYPSDKLVERGAGLTLTCPTPIIQKTDTATVTATLKDGVTALTGETLSYEIKHGQTTIDTGTDTTDNNGQITISYTGTGIGDVDVIISYSSLLQETFVIQDCDYYADSTKISNWNNVSSGGTQFKVSTYSIGLSDFSVEMKFNTIDAQIMVGNQSTWLGGISLVNTPYYLYTHSSSGGTVTDTISNPVTSDVWRMEVEGTTIRLYRNDNLLITKTNCKVDYPKTLRLYPQGKSASVDYVKVKAL